MESDAESDDGESSDTGESEGNSDTGTIHDKQWTTVTTRYDDNMPGGRRNEEGWIMWRQVMSEIDTTDNVRETVTKSRSEATQRTHCAALARFVRICKHLDLEWKGITEPKQIQRILGIVLDWSGRNGGKIYWIKKIRTAVSVLYNYSVEKEMSDTPLIETVVHAHAQKQLQVRTPLRLKWEFPQLMKYVNRMGSNTALSHQDLTRKCICLMMASTCARFTEISQFSLNASDPEERDTRWDFVVKIKNREYKQPVELHSMQFDDINPIEAMKELRKRIRRKRRNRHQEEDTFWYTGDWKVMSEIHIRQAALHLMQDAGIQDHRPYHIKHASVTWLKKKGATAGEIRRLCRHEPGSTVWMENYLSEDMGVACNRLIERAICDDDSESNSDNPEEKGRDGQGGGVWESTPHLKIQERKEEPGSSSEGIPRPTNKRFLRSSRK
jgi:site-specific recombinase XerD